VSLLLSIFANDVLPVFLVAGVGFLLARRFSADVKTLSRITFNALAPCLVFRMLVGAELSADDFTRMALLALLTIAGIGLVARLAVVPFRPERAMLAAFLLVVMFSNSGNYGLPVVLFAFGREGLAHGTVYFVVNAILTYTVGVFLAASGHRPTAAALAGVLRVPVVYAVLAAIVVTVADITPPPAIDRAVALLADAALPGMLLVLGMQLERGAWPSNPGLVGLAVGLSLVVTPLLAAGLAHVLGLGPVARQVAIVQAGMPSAVLTTIIALEFDVAPSFVTSCVTVSTLLSPLSITLLIAAVGG
jgi:predicted permease